MTEGDKVLTGTSLDAGKVAETTDVTALAELKAAHQRELDSWKSKNEELSRDKGNLLNQTTTLKRQLETKQDYGQEVSTGYPYGGQRTQPAPEAPATQNVTALEGELKGMRFFQHANRKGTDLSDPHLRPLLVQAEAEAVREMQMHGLDPTERANEVRLFDEVVAQIEKNELYKAYRGLQAQAGEKPKDPSATEVTATGATGGRSASDGGVEPSKEEAAKKRTADILKKVYPEGGGRRTPNPF